MEQAGLAGRIMEFCGLKDRKTFRSDYILSALKDGAIERRFPDKPNHPKQQYKLTAKALEWKHKLNEMA